MVATVGSPEDDDRDDTKRRILQLVSEISRLSRQPTRLVPVVYYREFLSRVVTALAAAGGAVWLSGPDSGHLELQYQINLKRCFPPATSEQAISGHARMLRQLLATRLETRVQPHAESSIHGTNPTEHLIVVAPVLLDDVAVGVVEIFQRPTAGPASQRGYLRFLVQMCEQVSDYLKRQP